MNIHRDAPRIELGDYDISRDSQRIKIADRVKNWHPRKGDMTEDASLRKKLGDAVENCLYIPRRGEMAGHAVIVRFDYGSRDLSALFELEDQLMHDIFAAGVGEFDGEEIACDGRDGFLYMYGPDADALFSAIKTTLTESTAIRNAVARLRYGPAVRGTRQVKVAIEHANLSYIDFPSTARN